MAINIKDPETDRAVRELAAEAGESITDALRIAAQERLQRLRRAKAGASRRPALQAYIDRGRLRPTLDPRTPDEILGYDEHGLPR